MITTWDWTLRKMIFEIKIRLSKEIGDFSLFKNENENENENEKENEKEMKKKVKVKVKDKNARRQEKINYQSIFINIINIK